jgi:putative membrane-bound dehydrogenase-like protein
MTKTISLLFIIGTSYLSIGSAAGEQSLKNDQAIPLEDLLSQRESDRPWTALFNGKDFSGFYTHLQKLGRNNDPDRVFQVANGEIHLFKDVPNGKTMPFGGFVTEKEYADYHLRFDYKWGEKKFPPRGELARDAGLLYHVVGYDGAFLNDSFPRSLECQVIEQGTGDYYGVGTQAAVAVDAPESGVAALSTSHMRVLGKAQSVTTIKASTNEEKDGWNTVEVIVRGSSAVHIINGKPVLYLTNAKIPNPEKPDQWIPLTKGKLWFQAEGAEVFYRKIEIRSLPAYSGQPEPPQKPKKQGALNVPPPLSPEDSAKKIHLPKGFRVELAAAEPLLLDPVAFDWDEMGRLWVVEMADYPLGVDGNGKPGGRVRILQDTDGDGTYDKSTLFAEDLNFPNGILCWRGGAIVTAAPEILFLEDKNKDGKAETRETLFKGFHEGNQQLRVNGLRWGLDNWVYCSIGAHVAGYGEGTTLKAIRTGKEVPIGARDFRFNPDTGEIDPQSGPTQFGRNRDDWGHWFGTQNSWPLWHYILQDHYLRRNPYFAAPNPRLDLVKPANPKVYPATPPAKRYHDFKSSGHFTAACSGMVYRDDLLFTGKEELQAFICEPAANLIQRQLLKNEGVSFAATRSPEDQPHDFFASEDPWCRPVMVRTGPDGALWVADIYRFMIEHPHWLPKEGKEELLPHYRLGEDRGRIYRIVPKASEARPILRLDQLDIPQLIEALDSTNGWQRDKVHQVLIWRKDATSLPLLKDMVSSSTNPLARLHALCVLDALNGLDPTLVVTALRDSHAGVRENALRLAEKHQSPEIISEAANMVSDKDLKVILQLACSLGAWKDANAGAALGDLAVGHPDDPWIQSAIMSSAVPHAGSLVSKVLESTPSITSKWRPLLFELLLGLKDRDSTARLLQPLLISDGAVFHSDQLIGFHQFLKLINQKGTNLSTLATQGNGDTLSHLLTSGASAIFEKASEIARDPNADPSLRISAASLLGASKDHQTVASELLTGWLKATTSPQIQAEAVQALAGLGLEDLPTHLAKRWAELGPETRMKVLDAWVTRESWTIDLLGRLQKKELPISALDTTRRSRLLQHHSKSVRELAQKVFSTTGGSSRASIVESYRSALTSKGDAKKGQEVYRAYCSSCHVHGADGREVGPDLASVVEHPPEKLLSNILDPNIDIQPGYQAYTCVLKNGEELYGLVTSETSHSFTLIQPDGTKKVILRQDMKAMRGANLSLMPDGLESAINPQDMAHLIKFLKTPVAAN